MLKQCLLQQIKLLVVVIFSLFFYLWFDLVGNSCNLGRRNLGQGNIFCFMSYWLFKGSVAFFSCPVDLRRVNRNVGLRLGKIRLFWGFVVILLYQLGYKVLLFVFLAVDADLGFEDSFGVFFRLERGKDGWVDLLHLPVRILLFDRNHDFFALALVVLLHKHFLHRRERL